MFSLIIAGNDTGFLSLVLSLSLDPLLDLKKRQDQWLWYPQISHSAQG